MFFSSIKQDPQFISLDTAFINNPSNETYLNLVTYINARHEEFKNSLNLSKIWTITGTMMSDDFIPMYNSSDKKENTYVNYTQGNIKFDSREEYVVNIKSLKQGFDEEKINLGIVIGQKIGISYSEKLEIAGLTLIQVGIFLFGFGLRIIIRAETPDGKEFGASLTVIGLILIIFGIIYYINSENNSSS
jgi:uncharacterized membrane protein